MKKPFKDVQLETIRGVLEKSTAFGRGWNCQCNNQQIQIDKYFTTKELIVIPEAKFQLGAYNH